MTCARVLAAVALLLALAACQAPNTPAVTAPALAAAPSSCHAVDGKADRGCTPGVPNPAVTQANIHQTICVTGWSSKTRKALAPQSYTEPLKRRQLAQYGEPLPLSGYEEDHLIEIEGGGSPTDPGNLWPQPIAAAKVKDKEENQLHAAVCSGRMTLAAAQQKIVADWTHG